MNFCEKNFDLDDKKKKEFKLKSLLSCGRPVPLTKDRHAQICDVDSGTCDFRIDSSRLFASVGNVHGSEVFLNLRHNSSQTKGKLVRMVDQNDGKFERFQNL